MARAATAVYLYCIVHAERRPSAARLPRGVPGAGRPEAHGLGRSLWMVTAAVPLDLYGPGRLDSRLHDLEWVSAAALAHEAVVERVARTRGATVIPMKLFTMFSSMEKAVGMIASRAGALRRTMRHIAGAEEWGVRVFRRQEASADDRRTATPASGAEFLRIRKQAREAVAQSRTAAAGGAERAYAALRRHARDARLRPTGRDAGANPPMLDAAFLVAAGARARFKLEARRQSGALERAGAALVLSGPWPAYTFVVSGERG